MKQVIALDADGVLLDYKLSYRDAWKKAFGTAPALKDVNAYWAIDYWDVRQLSGDELIHFRKQFDTEFWSNIPAIDGAVQACEQLANAGFELICVSAIEQRFEEARLHNLQVAGFPISKVCATSGMVTDDSPKAGAINALQPVAFVDDFLPYHRGVTDAVHKALILREPNGSPNRGEEMAGVHSHHTHLAAFADYWLNQQNHGFSQLR